MTPGKTADSLAYQKLVDENEQLRTTLESALDDNARLEEDRDRLLGRVAMLAREFQAAKATHAKPVLPLPPSNKAAADVRQSETEEELRVAFEELQVLAEELEVANTSLHQINAQLEVRVDDRTRALSHANHDLRKSETAFRTLVEGMPQLVWRSAANGDWTWSSPQWCAFTGQTKEASLGQGWLQALHPDDRAAALATWEKAEISRPLQFEAKIYHASENRYRHFQTRAAAALLDDGVILEWLGTSTDVDDIVQLRQRQAVLVDELQHRTRNLMAIVQAVILRTIKGSPSLEVFRHSIDDRMQALARAQGLLSQRGTGQVAFDVLLEEELAAHVELDPDTRARRVTMAGPRGIPLPSSIVQTYALALHELTTNATKYGALRADNGHLDVQWDVVETDGRSRLRVEWTESGVANMPEPSAGPQGGGYGRELIERALPYQLGAKTSYRFGADGVRCTIEVPLENYRKTSGSNR
jgi:PAS domain S-box-containing protein